MKIETWATVFAFGDKPALLLYLKLANSVFAGFLGGEQGVIGGGNQAV